MKWISLLFLFLFMQPALAQVVISVKGNRVTVDPRAKSFRTGESILFYDADLNHVASGRVKKITPNGTRVLVELTSGKVVPGMSLESDITAQGYTPSQGELRRSPSEPSYRLSENDRLILDRGELSTTRYVVGGILGTYPLGFGIGHAIQGRYTEKGWIFTVSELASLAVVVASFGDCIDDSFNDNHYGSCNGGLVVLGIASFLGFRIWEIVDVWAAPLEQNRKYRQLKRRMGEPVEAFVVPQPDGGRLGLRWSF